MSRRAEIVIFFPSHLISYLQRTGQLVSNSKVVSMFACSNNTLLNIHVNSFPFRTLLLTMSCNQFDSICFFFHRQFSASSFLSLRKLFFVSKKFSRSFFPQHQLCFYVFQVQAKYFVCFWAIFLSFDERKKTSNRWKLKVYEEKSRHNRRKETQIYQKPSNYRKIPNNNNRKRRM